MPDKGLSAIHVDYFEVIRVPRTGDVLMKTKNFTPGRQVEFMRLNGERIWLAYNEPVERLMTVRDLALYYMTREAEASQAEVVQASS